MMDALYLSGEVCVGDEEKIVWVPASSVIVLFLVEAVTPVPPVAVIIVTNEVLEHKTNNDSHQSDVSHPREPSNLFPINVDSLSPKVTLLSMSQCPQMIRNTCLPAVLSGSWCVVGTCSALRFVLSQSAKLQQNSVAEKLLGFRGGCLQSCSEVSCWTKFCEIEVPAALEKTFYHMELNTSVEFPLSLLRFNYHLAQPPITHNALKRKQEFIKKTVANKEERQRLMSLQLSELPNLKHEYAEGLDITLADVMLFLCFDLLMHRLAFLKFVEHTPLVLTWMDLIKSKHFIEKAMPMLEQIKSFYHPIVDVNERFITIPDVPQMSLYKTDPQRNKQMNKNNMTSKLSVETALSVLRCNAPQMLQIEYSKASEEQMMPLQWSCYPAEVHPQEGELPLARLQRKCEQLSNVVRMVMSVASPGQKIVDFCSGGGHVGILLAYCLPECTVLLVENKASSLQRAYDRVTALGLKNVEFYQCNLDYFKGSFDIGVCLHACGQATDLVLQKCFNHNASFVCSPCCYGAIKPNHNVRYPRSEVFSEFLPKLDDYLCLGHAADQTHGPDHPSTPQGQLCMRIIDTDRLEHAKQLGYDCQLFLMTPPTCSPKNHLLLGSFVNSPQTSDKKEALL